MNLEFYKTIQQDIIKKKHVPQLVQNTINGILGMNITESNPTVDFSNQ